MSQDLDAIWLDFLRLGLTRDSTHHYYWWVQVKTRHGLDSDSEFLADLYSILLDVSRLGLDFLRLGLARTRLFPTRPITTPVRSNLKSGFDLTLPYYCPLLKNTDWASERMSFNFALVLISWHNLFVIFEKKVGWCPWVRKPLKGVPLNTVWTINSPAFSRDG